MTMGAVDKCLQKNSMAKTREERIQKHTVRAKQQNVFSNWGLKMLEICLQRNPSAFNHSNKIQ
jgi:hypothetical protein